MNDYKTITRLFENDQDEIGFRLFKESNIIKLNNKNNNNWRNYSTIEMEYTKNGLNIYKTY